MRNKINNKMNTSETMNMYFDQLTDLERLAVIEQFPYRGSVIQLKEKQNPRHVKNIAIATLTNDLDPKMYSVDGFYAPWGLFFLDLAKGRVHTDDEIIIVETAGQEKVTNILYHAYASDILEGFRNNDFIVKDYNGVKTLYLNNKYFSIFNKVDVRSIDPEIGHELLELSNFIHNSTVIPERDKFSKDNNSPNKRCINWMGRINDMLKVNELPQ